MDVSRIRALRGPNLWSRHTAIQAIVTCTGNELAIARLPGFETRLRARFPELGELIPTDHLDSVSMAHALEYAALGLQAQAGCPVTFSRTTQTVDTGVYQVVVEYTEEDVGRLAFERAEQLCQAALDDTPFDLDATLKELRELDEDIRLGPSTGAIVAAAAARHISHPPPSLISLLNAAGVFWSPMVEFSTQPPLVINTRSFSVRSMLSVWPSLSVSILTACFLLPLQSNSTFVTFTL